MIPGDRVIAIDGQTISQFEEIADFVRLRPGQTAVIRLQRDGDIESLPIRFDAENQVDRFGNEYRIGRSGITPGERVEVHKSVGSVIGASFSHTFHLVTIMVQALAQVINGTIEKTT